MSANAEKDRATPEENRRIAGRLAEYADLLEQQGENGFRVRAYRAAAQEAARRRRPLGDVFAEAGRDGLIALPSIGRGIASAIAEMLTTGHWAQLDRLKGAVSPEKLFRTLPGIGPKLAETLAGECHLETLEDLEAALYRGEPHLPGIGRRRREALLAVLGERLGRPLARPRPGDEAERPPVSLLLQADDLYRARAAEGRLKLIAPKRFNPEGRAWLPILHATLDDWHFTALFSNTAQAHRLGRTGDWVVIFYQRNDGPEGRATVVTETRGPLEGRRVVRGRERECAAHYADRE